MIKSTNTLNSLEKKKSRFVYHCMVFEICNINADINLGFINIKDTAVITKIFKY